MTRWLSHATTCRGGLLCRNRWWIQQKGLLSSPQADLKLHRLQTYAKSHHITRINGFHSSIPSTLCHLTQTVSVLLHTLKRDAAVRMQQEKLTPLEHRSQIRTRVPGPLRRAASPECEGPDAPLRKAPQIIEVVSEFTVDTLTELHGGF